MTSLLSKAGNNAKTVKGDGAEYITRVMYLAPADIVEGGNVCPMAVLAGCKSGCLYTAGRGQMNSVQAGRMRKTILWRDWREVFIQQVTSEIEAFQRAGARKGYTPCVRLNGTSDIQWENYIPMEKFPDVQFYDYTKIGKRLVNQNRLSHNYHLTLSYSEANPEYADMCKDVLSKNPRANIAVVFRDKATIPAEFLGRKVIDGDKDDLRFLDAEGVVVGLYAKGKAKKDTSGFVIDV